MVMTEHLASGECSHSHNPDQQEEEGGLVGGERHACDCQAGSESVGIKK